MIRLTIITAVLFSGFFALNTYADNALPELPDKQNFKVFLLAGQSNMSGRGEVTEADLKIHPRVLMLAQDGSWQYAVDPIHYDKKIAGVGLGKTFAIELAELDQNISIGLVPAACGGSSITKWQAGAYFEKTDSHPYDDAIARARLAMENGTLSGILWHQGESDSNPDMAPVYKDQLVELVKRFRKDLDAAEVPFIIGQLGKFEGKPWKEERFKINQAHVAAASEIPFAGFVSSFGLTSKEDNTHFNTKSLHEFGRRYAHRYLQVVNDGTPRNFH